MSSYVNVQHQVLHTPKDIEQLEEMRKFSYLKAESAAAEHAFNQLVEQKGEQALKALETTPSRTGEKSKTAKSDLYEKAASEVRADINTLITTLKTLQNSPPTEAISLKTVANAQLQNIKEKYPTSVMKALSDIQRAEENYHRATTVGEVTQHYAYMILNGQDFVVMDKTMQGERTLSVHGEGSVVGVGMTGDSVDFLSKKYSFVADSEIVNRPVDAPQLVGPLRETIQQVMKDDALSETEARSLNETKKLMESCRDGGFDAKETQQILDSLKQVRQEAAKPVKGR